MLTITNTVTNYDAQAVIDKVTYAVHYIVANGTVTSIQCAISQEDNGMFEQVGFIRLENGRLNTDFAENISFIKYLTTFESLVKEINGTIKPTSK